MASEQTKTTKREPENPNFLQKAECVMICTPMIVNSKDWYTIKNYLAQELQTMFVLGLQEARERIKHDPTIGI